MNDTIMKYITAISAALFLFVAGSGIAMFFGVGKSLVEEMHEWLAIAFVIAIGLHLFRNWKGMVTYFRRRTIVLPVLATTIAAAVFLVPAALEDHRSPMPVLFQSLEQAKLEDLGRVLQIPTDTAANVLEQSGFVVHSTELSLTEIAEDSGRPAKAALMAVLDAKR